MKQITVVDTEVKIYDMDDVQWVIMTRCRPDKDMLIIAETPSLHRGEQKDRWGRLEFQRKLLRLAGQVRAEDWFPGR